MFNTIILDLDGPILTNKEKHYKCYSDILVEYGYIPINIDLYWGMKRKGIDRHQLLKLSKADSFYDTYLQLWLDRIESIYYLSFDILQPDVIDIMKNLKEKGVRIIVSTMRNNEPGLIFQLTNLGIIEYIDDLVVTGTLNCKTFKTNLFIKNLDKSKILWVGDTEADIKAAKSLDIKICALDCGLRTKEFLLNFKPDYFEFNLRSVIQSDLLSGV